MAQCTTVDVASGDSVIDLLRGLMNEQETLTCPQKPGCGLSILELSAMCIAEYIINHSLLGKWSLVAHHYWLSVAHPGNGGCATEVSPLKYNSVAHLRSAPQKYQNSVAHQQRCATEIFLWRISHQCATELYAPQKNKKMRHRII